MFAAHPCQQRIFAGNADQAFPHRSKVVNDALHTFDRLTDIAFKGLSDIGGTPIYFDLCPSLDLAQASTHSDETMVGVALNAQHRVHEEMDAKLVAVKNQPNRVDEKRHVTGDEQQDRPIGLPTVAFDLR